MFLLDTYNAGQHGINPHLLWEYDMQTFDWQKSRHIVVERVLEMGDFEDYYGAFDLYGIDGFRDIVKTIPRLTPRTANFASLIFDIPKNQMLCYTHRR